MSATMSAGQSRFRLAVALGCWAVGAWAVGACRVGGADGQESGAATFAERADSTPVRFTIDAGRRFPISPFVYGINFYGGLPGKNTPDWPRHIAVSRMGGNRLTAYNWENNASNAGLDYNYQNDNYLGGGSLPGEAVRVFVAGALKKGAGAIVTVPLIGHVARDIDGTSVGTDPATVRARLAARFVPSYPRKPTPLAPLPNPDDDAVYQDEFVAWLARTFPGAFASDTTPIFLTLDNEPDLWGSTHEEIMPKVDGKSAVLTYDDLIDRTIAYTRAIKDVAPQATIFGPGTATWAGAATLGRYPSPDPRYGRTFFLDVYLDRLRAAERVAGRRLVDVLDIHWYPAAAANGQEIGNDMAPQNEAMIAARLQAPRSLWDPTYDERSWVSGVQNGPIRLLPLLREKIAAHYPGTKIAITEYYYGRGGDISGGIAQADVLGIFGREGVYAATLWPNANLAAIPYGGSADRGYRYVIAAFRMFRDYDGQGSAFGRTGLAAHTSHPIGTSVYASADDSTASRVVLVAINKGLHARDASIDVIASHGWRTAEVYRVTDGAPDPQRGPDLSMAGGRVLRYTMPPMSISTLVLRP